MNIFTVSFHFQADSLDEARQLIGSWRVHPGVTMLSLTATQFVVDRPIEVRTEAVATREDNGGVLLSVEDGFAYAERHPPPDPVPKTGTPPQLEDPTPRDNGASS